MAIKTLVVKAGETGVIPSNARIISVGYVGNPNAQSDCADVDLALDSAETYQCYELAWEMDDAGGGGSGSWNIGAVIFEAIEVGETVYPIEYLIGSFTVLADKLKATVPSSLMKFGPSTDMEAFNVINYSDKINVTYCFSALPSVANTIRAKFSVGRLQEDGLPLPIYYIYARPLSKQTMPWCKCPTVVTHP